MRNASLTRKTSETDITLDIEILDSATPGSFSGSCGIGFFDHMLNALCVHGSLNIKLSMTGDLGVDTHHSIEDLGLVLGEAVAIAAGNRGALCRYGCAYVPMDESLARVVLDVSGRPYLVFNATFTHPKIGELDTDMIREFFYAFAMKSGITLHAEVLYGINDHHKAEALFKAFAKALSPALQQRTGGILSTKGTLN